MKLSIAVSVFALSISALGTLSAKEGAEGSASSEKASSTAVASTEEMTVGSNKEKVICKRNKIIGSRLKTQRVCKTAQEWAWEKQMQREKVEKGQNQRTAGAGN